MTSNARSKSLKLQTLSMPGFFLRAEALVIFLGAIALYAHQGYSGIAFVVLLLVPDVSMVGYLVNVRMGSVIYNVVHVNVLPAILITVSLALNSPVGIQIALIWFAHIHMDRIVGYGLKYPTFFQDTHLQHV